MKKKRALRPKHDINQTITLIVRVIFLAECILAVFLGIRNWDGQSFLNAFISILGFALTFIPVTVEKMFKNRLKFSSALKLSIVLFIFCAEFLGEIRNFYIRFSWWDTMLHTMSGVILALIGFMLVHALNSSDKTLLRLSPGFVALFAFAFALASGALWEILEFAGDRLLGINMQKYLPVDDVMMNILPDGSTIIAYGPDSGWRYDAGLIDTMADLIFDALSALIVSVLGYFSLKANEKYKSRHPKLKKLDGWGLDFEKIIAPISKNKPTPSAPEDSAVPLSVTVGQSETDGAHDG